MPQRKLHRLKTWDYSQCGYYFITVCTKDKRKLLATIRQSGIETAVVPTPIGQMVLDTWKRTEEVYPSVKLDYYCLMPNHLHGILVIEKAGVSLHQIIHGFKSVTTRQFNSLVPTDEKNTLWQLSFYDEIIRNDEMLYRIRNYIQGNPSKWMEDDLYIK